MALGSLATIAAMVLVAVQGPKYFQPSGAAGPPVVAMSRPTQNTPVQAPQPATQPSTELKKPAETAGSGAIASIQRPPAVAAIQKSIARQPPTQTTAQARELQVPTALAQGQATQPPVAQPAVVAPQPEPIKADDGKTAAIREQRELLMLLDTRANAIKGSLQTLQQQQARSGLNLRGDIVTAQQRMELFLNEAESAGKSGDPVAMKKNLTAAEREIEKLEKFLGR